MFEVYACVCFVYSYKAQFSWMWLSVFTSCFSGTKLCISRHKISIIFKLLTNISIAWNGKFYFFQNKLYSRSDCICWWLYMLIKYKIIEMTPLGVINIENLPWTVTLILMCFSCWSFLTGWQRIYFPEKHSQIKD